MGRFSCITPEALSSLSGPRTRSSLQTFWCCPWGDIHPTWWLRDKQLGRPVSGWDWPPGTHLPPVACPSHAGIRLGSLMDPYPHMPPRCPSSAVHGQEGTCVPEPGPPMRWLRSVHSGLSLPGNNCSQASWSEKGHCRDGPARSLILVPRRGGACPH